MTGVRVRSAVDRSILGLSPRLPEVATGFSGCGLIGSTHATQRVARRFTGPRPPSFHDKRSEPNKEVGAIHPNAMPVVLTAREEIDVWMNALAEEALKLQRPLPDNSLKIVARGDKKDEGGLAA
jgi:hypothetical protein